MVCNKDVLSIAKTKGTPVLLAFGNVVLSAARVKLYGKDFSDVSATHCFTESASSWTIASEIKLKNISEEFEVGACLLALLVTYEVLILG